MRSVLLNLECGIDIDDSSKLDRLEDWEDLERALLKVIGVSSKDAGVSVSIEGLEVVQVVQTSRK